MALPNYGKPWKDHISKILEMHLNVWKYGISIAFPIKVNLRKGEHIFCCVLYSQVKLWIAMANCKYVQLKGYKLLFAWADLVTLLAFT